MRASNPDSCSLRERREEMKRRIVLAMAVVVIAFSMVSALGVGVLAKKSMDNSAVQKPKMNVLAFHDAMRKLWEDHITWTRLAIVDLASGAAETNATVARLLQNQVDIGDAIKPFYGDQAGAQLTSLLKTHIIQAANIVVDSKAGNTAGANENITAWYANANEIAAFLSSANPVNWPLATMKDLMKMHLDLTLKEAVAQLEGNYTLSVATYDLVHQEILKMADVLSSGIILQFPFKFAGLGNVVK